MNAVRVCSLAAGVILDVAPDDAPGVARAGGWDAVGIWFDPASWTSATTRRVAAALRDNGVVALDVEPVIFGTAGDPGDALVDAAVELGARHVLVASRLPPSAAVIDRFGALCDRAGDALTVVLEFLPIFGVRTLGDAAGIVSAAGRPNSGVLIDTLHLARSGGHPRDIQQIAPVALPYLQIADAPATPPDASLAGLTHEALHGRLLPGAGALPLIEVLTEVPDVAVSVELRSADLMRDYPQPVDRAKVVLAATRTLLDGTHGAAR